jgi:DNA-binding transcriptional LysR family regulator
MAAYAVQAVAKGHGGRLRVGAVISSLYTVFPHLIPEFEAKFPAVDLQIQEMVVTQQLEALRQDRLDVGILRGPFPQADVNWVTLIKEPYVAAVPTTSALASQASVTVDALLEQPLIRVRYSTNREYSRQMFEYLLSQGRTIDIVREVADTHTLLAMVAAGAGVSFVPKSFRHIAINNVSYVPIDDESPTTAVQAVWRKDTLSPAAKNFVDLAVEITRDM